MQKSLPLLRSFLLAFSLCLLVVPAAAQITFGTDTVGARPLGLSISGGISLGSYQAGVNFGLLEVYRHAAWNPEFRDSTRIPRYRLRSVTGASAGNINTLLWAIEACTDVRQRVGVYRSPDPEESLFWQVWLEIGWDKLFDVGSREMALFDRNALTGIAEPLIEERMNDPRLVETCTVPAGITLTRIEPDIIRYQNLTIETQRHVTAFEVAVDSQRAPLGSRVRLKQADSLTNADQHLGIVVRLHPHDGDIPLDRMLEAVKASASFPVAFAPVELSVWYPDRGKQEHYFVDGGFFDNNPVGLARSIYGANGGRGTLDILYVDPDRFRSQLARHREARRAPPPTGGLAAVIATFSGAVPTARQYELQLLARERRIREREIALADSFGIERHRLPSSELPRERLLISERSYPVLGERLASFGGFLARPGREFDFYVGLYDGLYLTAWHHTCGGYPDSSAIQQQAKHRCVGEQLPRLIGNENLVRDPARHVLALLYGHEFTPIPVSAPRSEAMAERVAVQRAFFRALGTQLAPGDPEECYDKRLVAALLCADGFLTVLDTLRDDARAYQLMSDWRGACAEEYCQIEDSFVNLLDDPMAASTSMMDDVMHRFTVVEGRMKSGGRGRGKDYLKPVAGARWLFEATHLRSRPLRDLVPGSVPNRSRASIIPISYLGANLGTSGIETRWTPTVNMWSWGYVRLNGILHYNGEPVSSRDRTYGGVGLGVGVYSSTIVVSEFGIGVNRFRGLAGFTERAPAPREVELHGVFVANQLRLGLRWLPDGDHLGLLHGRRGWAFSAGLNDPVGLAYWIVQLSR